MGTMTLYKVSGPALGKAGAVAQGKEERLSCSKLKCSLSWYNSAPTFCLCRAILVLDKDR